LTTGVSSCEYVVVFVQNLCAEGRRWDIYAVVVIEYAIS